MSARLADGHSDLSLMAPLAFEIAERSVLSVLGTERCSKDAARKRTMNDNNPTPAVTTVGALFSTGAALEQIADRRLLSWQQSQARIDTSVTLLDHTFVPVPLDPALERMMQFSDGTLEFQAPEELLSELCACFEKGANLESLYAHLVASFVVSTWVPEALPARPILNLWGRCGSEHSLWRMLLSLVRHPLQLADCSLPELARLPESLHPTLMLFDPKTQVLNKLVAASRTSSLGLLRRGQLSSVGYAAIVCTTAPLEAPALCLPLPRFDSQRAGVTAAEQEALRARFVPRLLAYRLSQHRRVATAQFSLPGLMPETTVAARVLTMATAAAPKFQQQLAADLQTFDDSAKTQKSEEPAAIVLEAVLALIHQGSASASVGEITENANAIYFGRDEGIEMTARKVGHILRQELGLYPKRKGPGCVLQFDRAASARIHRLCQDWAVLSLQNPQPDCPFCQGSALVEAPASAATPAPAAPDPAHSADHADMDHSAEVPTVCGIQPDGSAEGAREPHETLLPHLEDAPERSIPEARLEVFANAESNVHDVHEVHLPESGSAHQVEDASEHSAPEAGPAPAQVFANADNNVHDVHNVHLPESDPAHTVEDASERSIPEAGPKPAQVFANADNDVHDVHEVHSPESEPLSEAKPISADDLLMALSDGIALSHSYLGNRDPLAGGPLPLDLKLEDAISALEIAHEEEEADDLAEDVDFDSFPGFDGGPEDDHEKSWQEVS